MTELKACKERTLSLNKEILMNFNLEEILIGSSEHWTTA